MRNIVLVMHMSLDGYVAGLKGEFDWVSLPEDLFDFVGTLTAESDTALYGRSTFQMMDSYWPTAGDEPDASNHDKEHSAWYNRVKKLVVSRSLTVQDRPDVEVIGTDLAEQLRTIKQQPGNSILIFGSASTVHALMKDNLIDEYWLFVNPVLLGSGMPLFKDLPGKINLNLVGIREFGKGVLGLHYQLK